MIRIFTSIFLIIHQNSDYYKNNFSGNLYSFKIVHDGKDPMILFKWDKESSYSVQAHGTCKGLTGGMCGSWDGNKNNDFTGPEGVVLNT